MIRFGARTGCVWRPRWAVRGAAVLGLAAAVVVVPPASGQSTGRCGEVVSIATHDGTTTRYTLAGPAETGAGAKTPRVALVLLPGGGGHLDLAADGCPRALQGNSLVRKRPLLHAAGIVTALVDSPSDHTGEAGLAGFRIAREHAADLGRVIADVRARTGGPVWVAGTSRGTISAVNAAARLSGPSAPDGIVITSILSSGDSRARLAWVAQSVFDLPLGDIRVPALLIGHADDTCVRSPARLMESVGAKLASTRRQVVTVTGGAGPVGGGIDACAGRSPHGFIGQEAEVVAGMVRFINGSDY